MRSRVWFRPRTDRCRSRREQFKPFPVTCNINCNYINCDSAINYLFWSLSKIEIVGGSVCLMSPLCLPPWHYKWFKHYSPALTNKWLHPSYNYSVFTAWGILNQPASQVKIRIKKPVWSSQQKNGIFPEHLTQSAKSGWLPAYHHSHNHHSH